MPRPNARKSTDAEREQAHDFYSTYGFVKESLLLEWDAKPIMIEAIFALVADGQTVVIQAGSGGGSIGVALWEGQNRRPATWSHDPEEFELLWEQLLASAKRSMAAKQER